MLNIGRLSALLIIITAVLAAGCTQPAETAPDRETMYQVSTFSALSQGVYEGIIPVVTLLQNGDTGLGTFDALDGEMVCLEGKVYQVKGDGTVVETGDNVTVPFAAVTFFDADSTRQLEGLQGLSNLTTLIDAELPSDATMYALKVHGNFSHVKTRSVPAQEKPYPALVDAVKNQSVFERENVSGTIVGVRFPAYMDGVNVAGYHCHFISDDRQFGGHLLDCTLENGTLMIDGTDRFVMVLPRGMQGVDSAKADSSVVSAIEQ
ncbi:acetolactate decarboxylase [Methanocella arvoryzae]|uniref:Alpha-acetolactate decarboxylase n=1 Tax=Methanocella arvoryzae (strain DSM 22066 / NBRC 105507 / MRE50) TaxID=351160 RepID=Q0W228_METAR|nr:acetolactate decarboxylase [Methanocella arvoryzae]CAJ37565.1 alpha-acetolactate decarboxylase [Methanocella arvoryzae MRE50]